MDFQLPSPEELSALELDAQLWPEEYEDDGSDWRTSRVSGWLEATSGHHSPCLRDSPLLGFYNDPTVDRAMEDALEDDEDNWLNQPGPSDADTRLLRAMASCPDLRENANGDIRRAREDWRREKAIRTQLEVQEADRRRVRDAERHQSDPYNCFSAPPPSPITTSRPVSRVIVRAASREWRNGLYAPSLEDIVDTDAPALTSALLQTTDRSDPRSITPTPISVVIPSADNSTELPYARDLDLHQTLSTPTSPVRHRPSPIMVPERADTTTPRPDDAFFPLPPQGLMPSTPQSATRARSGSAGTSDSRSSAIVPTPALSFSVSSPSASESKFEDSDDEDGELKDTLAPPIRPFVLRKARWSFGSSSKVSLLTAPSIAESSPLAQEVKIASPKPSRSAPSLFERAARRLSSNPPPRPTEDAPQQQQGSIAFPVQRSPSHRKSRRPTTADSTAAKPSPSLISTFLSEDPFASSVGVLASPPTSPTTATPPNTNFNMAAPSANVAVPVALNVPKRKMTRSFSNFSIRAAIDSITHRKSSVSKVPSPNNTTATPSPLLATPQSPLPAPPRAPAMTHKSHSSSSSVSTQNIAPVLVVSGLATRMTDDEGLIRTIAAWATGLVRTPAAKIRRRSDGTVHVHFRQVVDVKAASIPPSAVIPSLGEVQLKWINEDVGPSPPPVPAKDVNGRRSRPGTANANAGDAMSMAGLSVMPIIPGAMMAIR